MCAHNPTTCFGSKIRPLHAARITKIFTIIGVNHPATLNNIHSVAKTPCPIKNAVENTTASETRGASSEYFFPTRTRYINKPKLIQAKEYPIRSPKIFIPNIICFPPGVNSIQKNGLANPAPHAKNRPVPIVQRKTRILEVRPSTTKTLP